jgi:protein-S-isoprenylcysteine O-methyltransferase Ste14
VVLLTLGCATALWCVCHSLLAAERAKDGTARRVSPLSYRKLYNIVSFASLLPVALLYAYAGTHYLIRYTYPSKIVIDICFVPCLLVWLVCLRRFDVFAFLGLRPEHHRLITDGVYRYSRHPIYASSIGLLWARNLQDRDVVINAVFTVYLIVGAFIEERRLVREYGDAYHAYRRRTSMFVPFMHPKRKAAAR